MRARCSGSSQQHAPVLQLAAGAVTDGRRGRRDVLQPSAQQWPDRRTLAPPPGGRPALARVDVAAPQDAADRAAASGGRRRRPRTGCCRWRTPTPSPRSSWKHRSARTCPSAEDLGPPVDVTYGRALTTKGDGRRERDVGAPYRPDIQGCARSRCCSSCRPLPVHRGRLHRRRRLLRHLRLPDHRAPAPRGAAPGRLAAGLLRPPGPAAAAGARSLRPGRQRPGVAAAVPRRCGAGRVLHDSV